ncbi:hypothetical protein IB239_05750 [Pseudomonas sp. PDM12]|uniref:hypothetical protein n=1 Tax=Pseudomonas sp. PDM12 TaxID=2769260 RepID=UPI001783B63E|nr:hypothetical protein [Pseudomonas sp. PDM12]MBD9654321.1 hypothetical protein [Pseudomonas sp. PDM12]
MYISKVLTYGVSQKELLDRFPYLLAEISESIKNIDESLVRNTSHSYNSEPSGRLSALSMRRCWEKIAANNWPTFSGRIERDDGSRISLRLLGYSLGGVSCAFNGHQDAFNRWLYSYSSMAMKKGLIECPVIIVPMRAAFGDDSRSMLMSYTYFEKITGDFKTLEPLSHPYEFVVIGVEFEEHEVEWVHINSLAAVRGDTEVINRCIEFPPEFRQAGLGILNYFGEVLREKYPDEKAKVRIEQDGLTVRMVVESEGGSREVIEKALREYELVVLGQKPPESLFTSQAKVVELKNELRVAQARIESQKDIIQLQRSEISNLSHLFGQALGTPSRPIEITVAPSVRICNEQKTSVHIELSASMLDDVQELVDQLSVFPSVGLAVGDLYESLDPGPGAEKIPLAGMAKLKSFIEKATDVGSEINEAISSVESGIETIKSIGRKYNSIAEWCGAPQIPRAFID